MCGTRSASANGMEMKPVQIIGAQQFRRGPGTHLDSMFFFFLSFLIRLLLVDCTQ